MAVCRLAADRRLSAGARPDGACRSAGFPDGPAVGGSAGRPGGVAARRAAGCHGARDPADAQAGMSADAVRSGAATGSAGRVGAVRLPAGPGTGRAGEGVPWSLAERRSAGTGDVGRRSAWLETWRPGAGVRISSAELGSACRGSDARPWARSGCPAAPGAAFARGRAAGEPLEGAVLGSLVAVSDISSADQVWPAPPLPDSDLGRRPSTARPPAAARRAAVKRG